MAKTLAVRLGKGMWHMLDRVQHYKAINGEYRYWSVYPGLLYVQPVTYVDLAFFTRSITPETLLVHISIWDAYGTLT